MADRHDVEEKSDRGEQRRDPDDRPRVERGKRLTGPIEVERSGGGDVNTVTIVLTSRPKPMMFHVVVRVA